MDLILKSIKIVAVFVAVMFAGACGWLGMACAGHLYQDHLLVDGARATQPRPASTPQPPQ